MQPWTTARGDRGPAALVRDGQARRSRPPARGAVSARSPRHAAAGGAGAGGERRDGGEAESFGVPSRASFDRLMAQVASAEQQPRRAAAGPGAVFRAHRRLDRRPLAAQIGGLAAAAALLVAVQGGLTGYLVDGVPSATYQTASAAATPGGPGTFALVSFKPTATAAEITAALAELERRSWHGPKAGGVWRVRLSPERSWRRIRPKRVLQR